MIHAGILTAIFLMEIPEGFAGVKDARIENGEVRVIPR